MLKAVEELREELDDYREAINENTTEIQSNYALVLELDRKLERVMERLEALELSLKGRSDRRQERIVLSGKEKVVFRALYELGVSVPFVSYRDIAKRAGVSLSAVGSLITGLIERGVPLVKRYEGCLVFVKLEEGFRQEQAKRNLVGLEAPLSCWLKG